MKQHFTPALPGRPLVLRISLFFVCHALFCPGVSHGQALSFTFNGPVSVPDNLCSNGYNDSGEVFPIAVSGIGVLGPQAMRLDSIRVNLTMTWNGDLQIWLESPTAEVLELSTTNGGSGDNYSNTIFWDGASEFITAGISPFLGSYRPEGRINVIQNAPANTNSLGTYTISNTFNGIDANGIWKLRICDAASQDIAAIQSWSLYFSSQCSGNSNDASISSVSIGNQACAGTYPIDVWIQNAGTNSIDNVEVHWSVNNIAQSPAVVTNSISACDSLNSGISVNLGSLNIQSNQSYDIKIWTTNPNGMSDSNNFNDTLQKVVKEGLSGTYTIGGVNPDYPNFTAALNDLISLGVCGPVVFSVRNDTYNEQINIPAIPGANANHTITFESESGDSSAVVLQFNSANSAQNYVVRMADGDWIRFRKMTFRALNTNFGQVVNFAGNSDNNIFEHNQFIGVVTTNISSDMALIYSPGGTIDNGNIFRNNFLKDGSDGIWIAGGLAAADYESGNIVEKNRFENQYRRTINLAYQNASVVDGNIISSNTTYNSYNSVVLYFCNGAQRITNNILNLNSSIVGIAVDNCAGITTERGLIANNFIQVGGSFLTRGFWINASTNQDFYFNSIHVNSSNTESNAFSLLTGGGIRLFNNIGFNSTNGLVLWRNSTTNIEAANHNDFFTTGVNLAYNLVGNLFFTNLDAWKTGTGFDLNSLSVDPQFVSSTDLHTSNSLLDGQGMPFPNVQTDIDGDFRFTTTPDIGADEFIYQSEDAALVRFVGITPPVPVGPMPIRVLVNNNGMNTLSSLQLYFSVNNAAPVQISWSGTLASGDTTTISLDTLDFSVGQSLLLRAWCTQPNGQTDQNPANDTARLQTQGLIAHYSFCGCSPDDNSGMANDGVLVGNPACAPGKGGPGLLLNPNAGGNNGCGLAGGQYVQLPALDAVWQDGFTVSAWVRFDSPSSYERIVDIGNGNGDAGGMPVWFGREATTNNLMMDSWISSDGAVNLSTGRLSAPNTIINGVFQHYCATIGPGNLMRIYVNGELKAEKTGHPILNVPRNSNFIGHSNWCGSDPDIRGLIDDWRLYNRALSPAEINTLYQQSPGFAEYSVVNCAGAPVQLEARGGIAYQWSPVQNLSDPNIANPVATPVATTTYTCQVTLEDGCMYTDSLQLVVPAASALNGAYTIGGTSPDYPTFTAAVTALTNNGVCGPVVFKVRNGTYNEQITIQAISGASAFNTITFESETGDSTAVTLSYTSTVSTTPWTLRLLGVKYVTFQKMTIEANGTTYAQAVQVAESGQFNQLLNNILRSTPSTSTSSNRAVVFCGSGVNQHLIFRKNRFVNGSTGLWFEGNTNNGNYIQGIVVDSNAFENQYERGTYLSYVNKAKIRFNTMASTSAIGSYIGVRVLNSLDSTIVLANRIANLGNNAYGLRLENMGGTVLAPVLVANNFIELMGTTTRQGIYVSGGNYLQILHNTVRILNTSVDSRALELTSSPGNVVLRNNILSNIGGGYALYRANGTITSNYNALHSSGARTGYWAGTIAASLADWRSLSGGQDQNSLDVDPKFTSPGQYRPRVLELNDAGVSELTVSTDIEGEQRNTTNPDIGADEYEPETLDAAVLAFVGLQSPVAAGQTPIKVLLKNNGLNVITAVSLKLRVNNNAPLTTNWTGNLSSGDTVLVELDSVLLIAGQVYDLYAWSEQPNGSNDPYPNNDTTLLLNLVPALNGVYTIGGIAPDFPTFAAAANALNVAGVIGPVTFNVRNGTYNEIVTISAIIGVDSTRRVVFQSETGDSTQVVLTFAATSSAAPWTLRLNGADYCTFRRMTIEATGTSFAQVVQIIGDAQNNTFENNILRGRITTSTSSNYAVVFSNSGINNSLTIKKSVFQNGSTGLHFLGNVNGNTYISGIVVDSNVFTNQYHRAVYVEYTNSPKIRWNTLSSNSTYGFYEGVLVIRALNAVEVSYNRMSGIATNGDGIILQFITGTASEPVNIFNNFIQISGATARQGLYCLSTTYVNFLYNTVRVLTTNQNGVFYIQSSNNVSIRNNIFENTGGGLVFTRTGGGTYGSNYNNLYTTGAVLGSWDGTTAATLANWQAVTGGQDAQSVSLISLFTSSGTFRPRAIELNGAANPETLVPLDIEGETRSLTNPDIGADEFEPDSLDAAILAFIGLLPPVPAGSTAMKVILKNNGSTTLTSLVVYLKVNNNQPLATNWTGSLPSGAVTAVTLDSVNLIGGQVYNLYAWSEQPNGISDQYPANDSTQHLYLLPALNGIYTIGGAAPDFPNFTAAAAALMQAGVSGPVTFNARPGTYTEQITLGEIPGVDSTKQVIFQSESGDSTSTVLRFNATSTNNFTVRLNGTDWITFQKMTLEGQNTTNNRVLVLENGANSVTVSRCVLMGTSSTSVSTNRALVYASGTLTNNKMRLVNNRMLNGGQSIYYISPITNSIYAQGTHIVGNQMIGQYSNGIYLSYNKDAFIENNTIISSTSNYSSFEGIRVINAFESPKIVGNRIISSSDGVGIFAGGNTGTAANPVLIANNFIRLGTGTSTVYGINFSGTEVNVIHNTIRIGGTSTNSTALLANTNQPFEVINNTLSNFGSGRALWVNSGANANQVIDHNDLYTTGSTLVFDGNNNFTDLNAWKNSGFGFDENSISVNPLFFGPDDFRVAQSDLNGAGTPSAFVTTDIEGDLRNVQTPDIGADEFTPAAADAGVTQLITPTMPFPAGQQNLSAVVKNYGSSPLISVSVYWTVNGVPQPPVPWTGNLAPGATQNVPLAMFDFVIGQSSSFVAWASDPNSMTDQVPANDTARVLNLYPALSGLYTIGGGGPDFTNFTQAVSALQNGGMVGPVTFNARNGTYAEQIILSPILGASAVNTITFQSEANDSTAVTLQFNANSTNNFTVRLNGADWIRFRKMTLQALNGTYGNVVNFNGGSDDNIIENCRLLGFATTSALTSRAIIYSNSSRNDRNTFKNSHFINGSHGMFYYGIGSTPSYNNGTVIENNRFEGQYYRGIEMAYQNTPVIERNTIVGTSTAYDAAVLLGNCNLGVRVYRNKINLDRAAYGILLSTCSATSANRSLLANNFVQIGGTNTASGIELNSSPFVNLYFNSIHMNGSNTSSSAFEFLGSSNNLRLFNNIGYNTANGYVINRSSASMIEASNNNNFLTTGTNLVYNAYNTTWYTSLTAWQNATGFDGNSLSTNPLFVSATDLHTTNILLDAQAQPFAEVPTDIDGQFRNATTPDIGADEFSTTPNEAGILSVDYPKKAFEAGTQPVQVTLINNGVDTLQALEIEWEVNGVAQPAFTWTGTLPSGGVLDSVIIGTALFTINTAYSIRAWTTMPNNMADGDVSNDTAAVNNLWAALGGAYTLGGTNPDFPTFASAVHALAQGGVVDSVFFNIRNGVYTEQITLKEVFGAGADKHITFQSESGDSTGVKLTFNSNSTNNFTVKIDSADWFRFRRMTLEATNGTYGRVVYLLNGAEHNRFENCVLQGVLTGTSLTDLVYSETTAENFTTFINNRFEGGYTGVYMRGTTSNEAGLVVQNNIFNNQNYRPIFLSQVSGPIIRGNRITQILSNTATSGVYLFQCNTGFLITNNQIRLRRLNGIFLDDCDSPVGSEGLVANNFITIGEGLGNLVYGIYLSGSNRTRVYFNSINLNSTEPTSYALYNTSNNSLEVKNNIFACTLGARAIFSSNATNFTSNFNNFFTTGSQMGYWESATVASLADWQAASGQDANSISINPQFLSNSDLHVLEAVLNGAGTPIATVLDDIDGESRHPLTPDIGADEFAPMTMHDVGIEVLMEPNKVTPFPAGLREVKAVLKNNGIDTVMTTTVQWRVNNVPKTPYNWAGMLYPGERDTIVIGAHNFAVGVAHNLIAYTQNPDGFPDNNPANDTAKLNDLYAGLSGTYTIGGVVPNFATFSSAVNALKKGGVIGPVIFDVRNGTYTETETLLFENIKGANADNRMVFQSETGDSSLVTLTRSGSSGYVVRLNNADFLTFRKMTFRMPNGATVFYLENGSNDIHFLNNRFSDPLGTFSTYIYGASGTNALEHNIEIKNNRFEGTGYAIRLSGGNTSLLETGTRIENNVFDGTRNNAVILEYQDAPHLIGNTFVNANRPFGCSYCDNALQVFGNRISSEALGNTLYNLDLYFCDGTSTNRGLIANNFVQVGGNQYVNGIRLFSCNYQNVYYNSVHVNNTNTTSRALNCDNGSNIRLQNNIFANSGGGYALYNTNANSLAVSNFNDLYSTGTNLAAWAGTNVANLQALRNLSGREQNSVSANPLFYSATDLHVLQVALDSAASFTLDVLTDIDGQARNTNYPDIGADEFDYLTDDLGITGLLAPVAQCDIGSSAAVKVVIQNFGGLPQTGFDVIYRRGYGSYVVENIGARVVQPGDTIHYTFAQTTNMSAYKDHMFTLFTALNGDLNPPNDTLIAWVTNHQTPTVVANMLPADGTTNVSPPVSFSWLPASGATRYDIYIWKADQFQPITPTGQDLTQISYYHNPGNLVYGAAYKWQVVAKNDFCQTAGPMQQFTLRELPDLTVGSTMAPTQPFSGTSISVSWQTNNSGSGSTGMSSWYDYVYLSTDNVYQPDADVYIGGAINFTALNPGQSYAQMAQVTLPQGIQGNYFLIVRTDANTTLPESNENNNTAAAFPITINLTPPPDLQVTALIAPNNAFSGQSINITWTVKNQGTGDMLANNNFRDYIYLSSTPTLNLNSATLLGTYQSGPLAAGVSSVRMLSAQLPQAVFGDYFIHVYTDRLNNVFEFAFEDNNIGVSDTLTIFLTPPPDLIVNAVSAPAFASNNQTVTVQWTVENQGPTTAANSWTDRVLISKAATYKPDSVTALGNFFNPGNLPAGETANRSGSVTIPKTIGGPYYFYVVTDVSNQVFEYLNENNNTHRSTNSTDVLNADLVVPSVLVPDTANSGTSIPVQWTVKNEGIGSLLNISRTDQIYLSQQPVLGVGAATVLGGEVSGGTLLSAQEISRQANVTLPNGISGWFYIHVLADAGNAVFEASNEGNNDNLDSIFINLAPWPDLIVSQINALADTILAGTTLPVGYSAQNIGTADLTGSTAWKDRIYISSDSVFSLGSATLLQSVDVLQALPVVGSYNRSVSLAMPFAAPKWYYLYVLTDADNSVYEYNFDGNNVLRSEPFYLNTPSPVDFNNFAVTTLPDTVNSGQSVSLTWCVRNIGSSTAVFDFPLWYDGVYLSTDSIWDEYDDIFVKDFTKNGPVDSLEMYMLTHTFNIPNGLSGNYYAFLVADHNERTNDPDRSNNIKFVRPASFPTGQAKPIHIKLSPSPDLAPMTFVAPTNAVAGQPVQVIWTVKNQGPGPTPANWTDKIYLSTDFAVGGNDQTVGTKNQNRILAPGQQYSDTMDVFIPISAVGNYVLIFATDANNVLFEFNGESNNTFFTFLSTSLPDPSDLTVTDIDFPAMAVVGQSLPVTWEINNQGANPATGALRELVYLSPDSLLDVTDIPLSSPLSRSISLVPGASASKMYTGVTPGVPLGNYHVIVATDVLDNIFESNEGNNFRISPEKIMVTVPELPIGVQAPDTLRNNIGLYYRIEVPDSLTDETLLLTLDALDAGGVNELYLSHNKVPTRSSHDFAFGIPFNADQSILVPELKPGTYYLLAYGATPTLGANAKQAITLLAEIINFSILNVAAGEGGNTGNVTLRVDGSKFTPGMTLKLKGPSLTTRTATKIIFVNSTRVFATFNLAGAPLGLYDMEASKQAETTLLQDCFTVVAGNAGTTSSGDGNSGFFCTIVNIGTDQNLSENIVHPPSVRINRLVPITIQYGNAGNVDIPMPSRFLISLRGAPLGFTLDELDEKKQELYLEFREIGGPPGILRPGSFSSITVYTYSSHPLSFILRE